MVNDAAMLIGKCAKCKDIGHGVVTVIVDDLVWALLMFKRRLNPVSPCIIGCNQ